MKKASWERRYRVRRDAGVHQIGKKSASRVAGA